MGRALSTANFFNFGGVFLIQWLTGKIITLWEVTSAGHFNLIYSDFYLSSYFIINFIIKHERKNIFNFYFLNI